jgi:riboflavin kinase/FMN adenylyltransferase
MKERIATIGFFDGVHKGHRYLFKQLDKIAAERDLAPFIVTFEQHPRVVLQSDYVPQLLTTSDERKVLLSAFGEVLMLPFADIQTMTAAQFMELLHTQYKVSVLLMGYDHRFGSDRLRHPQDYRRIGEQTGIEVLTMSEFTEGEWHVSSTEIRSALENGNIAVANDLLGRPYSIRGTVVHGKGIGRTIGFPTANIQPLDCHTVIPKAGVYAVRVRAYAFEWTDAMLNIDKKGTIEVHIPSFQGNLYDQPMDIRFMRFVREEKQIDSLDALQKQIMEDFSSIIR